MNNRKRQPAASGLTGRGYRAHQGRRDAGMRHVVGVLLLTPAAFVWQAPDVRAQGTGATACEPAIGARAFHDAGSKAIAERSMLPIPLVPGSDREASAKVGPIRSADPSSAAFSSFATRSTMSITTPNPTPATATDPVVAALVERATQAHVALMQGDLKRYRSQLETSDDFVLMAPFGGKPTRGATLTAETWEQIGRFFRNGRESTLELVQAWRSDELVVLAAIERTHAEVGGLPAQPWPLRVTLVLRRVGGQWLLAHRHADPLVEDISLQQAAALASRPSP